MTTHGYSHSPMYKSWKTMKRRCNNPKDKYHGSLGVKYDLRWEYFENFLADMGERPEGMTLDRFPDTNGDYCKDNCRWATPRQQANNRRNTGKTSGVSEYKRPGVWQASIRLNGKRWHLYNGPSYELAVEARLFAEEFFLGVNNK